MTQIYPGLRRLGINFSPLKKITAGFLTGSAAMIWAAVVQHYIYKVGLTSCRYVVQLGRLRTLFVYNVTYRFSFHRTDQPMSLLGVDMHGWRRESHCCSAQRLDPNGIVSPSVVFPPRSLI